MPETTDPQPDRSLRAVLTVTVETRPDGGHYFDQADFTAHATEWVRAALKGQHAVDEVTVVDQAAELARAQAEAHQYRTALQGVARAAVPSAPADRAAILRELAASIQSGSVQFNTEAAEAALKNGGPFALIAYVQLAIGEHLRRLAVEAPAPNRAGGETQQGEAGSDAGTEFVQQADQPDAAGLANWLADLTDEEQQPETPSSTAPLAAGMPHVQGNCPACQRAGLFLGSGGYVTCSNADCPEPDAATTVLERRVATDRAAIYREVAEELAGIDFHPNAKSQNLALCGLLAGRFRRKADEVEQMAAEAQQSGKEVSAPEVVAYRDPNSPKTLLCRDHGERWQGVVPVTAEELPDGGTCTFGRLSSLECGRDVLIPQQPTA